MVEGITRHLFLLPLPSYATTVIVTRTSFVDVELHQIVKLPSPSKPLHFSP